MYTDFIKSMYPTIVMENEPLKNHTHFNIGGPADCLVFPESVADIEKVIDYVNKRNISVFVFGSGSNLLVRDKGIRGICIKLGSKLSSIVVSGNTIEAQAGASLANCAEVAANNSLSGMEFAHGIPGSVGGAVFMNAGAYDGEMKDIVFEVVALNQNGGIKTYKAGELDFSYRHSRFINSSEIVLTAKMNLEYADSKDIYAKMDKLSNERKGKQPLEYPSAGSTFRRPPGYYVGPMIEEMGLKGYAIGGAQVSTKHAGFIINKGNATAQNVIDLINHIKDRAFSKYGVLLEPEVRIVGEP